MHTHIHFQSVEWNAFPLLSGFQIYKEAKECLNLLSYKLGKKEYMFGRQ